MLALLALLALASATLPLHVVVFEDDLSVADLHSHITAVLGDVSNAKYIYDTAIKGFAAQLPAGAMQQIQNHPKFKYMEEDKPVHILDEQQAQCATQQLSPSWGLPRISERELSDSTTYHYPTRNREIVTSYIIDTGIYLAHQDFQGRASFGFKAEASWSDTDGNGHGTHVASTVAGHLYGVAKSAKLVAVKVLSDGGSGSYAGVIAGCDWALKNFKAGTAPGTANLSLGGPFFKALNDALDKAMQEGLFVVVAAGNSNADSCRDSPSSAPDVITVGSTDISPSNTDIRSYFSSYGPCVDVWAPGSDITGAWIGSPTASRTISGTSMASPHVCGVATLVKGEHPHLAWDEVTEIITKGSHAVQEIVDLNCGTNTVCQASPNGFIFNGCHRF
jgi:subtilisin family serine protease